MRARIDRNRVCSRCQPVMAIGGYVVDKLLAGGGYFETTIRPCMYGWKKHV